MTHSVDAILQCLDTACDKMAFPMLDNAYIYLAATRLTAFRSAQDWALTIEVFGFSPRVGTPDTTITTFASTIVNRPGPSAFKNAAAYEKYLSDNPCLEERHVFPIAGGQWQDRREPTMVAEEAREVILRGDAVRLPQLNEYSDSGIALERSPRVQTFELCRWLAGAYRDRVLATSAERKAHVPKELDEVLRLDEWHHPDLANQERPSRSETFQQLAEVMASGDRSNYRPAVGPNTHWSNWPEGGLYG